MRVLVVEDDDLLCEVFRDYLKQLGHEPVIVRSAEAALAVLAETRPGAMLLDVRLPGMSGLDFLRLQSTRGLHVPIVAMSGMLSEAEARDCLRLGAVNFLGKPIALEHLRDILRCLEPLAEPEPAPETARRSPERRAAPRARVSLPVRVAEYGGTGWDATTVDLSVSGVKVRGSVDVAPVGVAKLSLPLEEGQAALEVASVLVRVDVDGYAFHFINLTDAQQERLQGFVRHHLDAPVATEPHARVLRSITQAFGGSLDLDETLHLALHALTHVTGHEVSILHLLSADRTGLQLRGERGLSGPLRDLNQFLTVGDGPIATVASSRRTLRVPDLAAAPDLWPAAASVLAEDGVRGFVCVPLQTRGQVLGTLSLGRLTAEPFVDAEVALLEAVATQLSLALDNARLYGETRRQLEELQHAQGPGGEMLTTMSTLASGLAHEINTPLLAILAQAKVLLRETATSQESRERLGSIIHETSRAARLLKTVLNAARPRRAERRECAVDAQVKTVLELIQPQCEASGIGTVLELEAVPPVWADPDQIRQVLLNLVQNALQAMTGHPGPRVLTARTQAAQDRVSVEVLDTGPGIPPEVLPRIFDAFFTTKAADEGTGLGLWVSADIAEQHGGRLHAANRPGGGAVFTLELPQRRGG
jgi:signal transduction histidine kinase/ActR/RegA family two-component response regulator